MPRFATSHLPSDSPPPPIGPLPVSVVTFPGPGGRYFTITFDQSLQPDPALSNGNWFPVFQGWSWFPNAAAAVGTRVSLRTAIGIPVGGPNRMTYFATPPDVISLATGIPAAPFADFLFP